MVKGKKDRRYQRNREKFWEKIAGKSNDITINISGSGFHTTIYYF